MSTKSDREKEVEAQESQAARDQTGRHPAGRDGDESQVRSDAARTRDGRYDQKDGQYLDQNTQRGDLDRGRTAQSAAESRPVDRPVQKHDNRPDVGRQIVTGVPYVASAEPLGLHDVMLNALRVARDKRFGKSDEWLPTVQYAITAAEQRTTADQNRDTGYPNDQNGPNRDAGYDPNSSNRGFGSHSGVDQNSPNRGAGYQNSGVGSRDEGYDNPNGPNRGTTGR